MLSSAEILVTYEALSGIMGNMLSAARAGDWDRLVELERGCAAHVGQLKESTAIRLSPQEQREKLDHLKRILRDDAAIRDLTEPRLAFLSERLGHARAGRQSLHAYR